MVSLFWVSVKHLNSCHAKIEGRLQSSPHLCSKQAQIGQRSIFCCAKRWQRYLLQQVVPLPHERFLKLMEQVEWQIAKGNFAFVRQTVG